MYTVTVLCTTIYLQDGRGLSPIVRGRGRWAGTLIELVAAGTADVTGTTKGVLRLVSLLSLIGGADLLDITLMDGASAGPPKSHRPRRERW